MFGVWTRKIGAAIVIVGVLSSLAGCGEDDPWVDHMVTVTDLRESLDRSSLNIDYAEVAPDGSQQAVLAGTAESPSGQKAAFQIAFYSSGSDVSLEGLAYVNRMAKRFGISDEASAGVLENIAFGRARIARGRDRSDESLEVEVMLDDAVFDAFPPDDPNVNPTLTSPFEK